MNRFIVTESKHIKGFDFEAVVMDTTKPLIISEKHYTSLDGALHYEVVCECYDLDAAVHIAEVLNTREVECENHEKNRKLLQASELRNAEMRDSLSRIAYPDTTGQ